MKQSRVRGKQKAHGCASGMEVMVRTGAIEAHAEKRRLFVKVHMSLRRGVEEAGCLGVGRGKSWREEKVEKWAR